MVARPLRILFLFLLASLLGGASTRAQEQIEAPPFALPEAIQQFLADYCVTCHGPKKQKGERRLDGLSLPVEDHETLLTVQEIIDVLTLGDMPPEEAKVRPPESAVPDIIAHLTQLASAGHERLVSTGGESVLRRLNRREYLNTIGDLFDLNMTMFDPTMSFPRDQTSEHMDNIGDALRTSGHLLAQYLDAADHVVEKALGATRPPPEQTWHFNDNFAQQPELRYAHTRVHDNQFMVLYEGAESVRHEGGYGPILAFAAGVPADGYYEIRVKAEALNRVHPYDPKIFHSDPAQPFRLGIVPGQALVGPLHEPQPIQPQLGEVVVNDGPPAWYTFRVWLDRGFTPRFTFPNGALSIRDTYGKVLRLYNDQFPAEVRDTQGIVQLRAVVMRHGFLPQLRLHEIAIRGPLDALWPTASQQRILGDHACDLPGIRKTLTTFATRAYRRPVQSDEVDRLMQVVTTRIAAGHSPAQALMDGIKAALCSPAFLYLVEPVDAAAPSRELDAYALASRLSYFLWSSMPDEALFAAAADGSLLEPAVLAQHTRRLLASSRADTFVHSFTDAWLNLRNLGDMAPDRSTFPDYYARNLEQSMKQETRLFTRDLLDRNESIIRFLDADYTFANRDLAQLYDQPDAIPGAAAHQFHRLNFPDPRRGGLLGQASVLTVSANGVETSPVTRGVWLLENILGSPPAPPPDDVPAIDPDIRGAKSIREILIKHRDTPACFECHRKIDPPGFALESFDPIGRWRTHYRKNVPIETEGELFNGTAFTDVVGLKRLLLERKDQFAHMFVDRLMTYACGRRMEAIDRAAIDAILHSTAASDYPLADLVAQVALSQPFRTN